MLRRSIPGLRLLALSTAKLAVIHSTQTDYSFSGPPSLAHRDPGTPTEVR
jgi:hypothetical protein